ncbi:2-dehydropantoate 2-reductase [Glaciecola sp. MH2013]|nr:2-dehydropantoate 2-reductase [Glaciecola sp. MH2013]MBF7073920.1 2-dehydropantoate 2-reductase [Glaciecola sp. MH2013]
MQAPIQNDSLKIVVFGAGSIGCYLGGCLLSVGANVTLIGRDRIQAQISENGLRVSDYKGRDTSLSAQQVKFTGSNAVMHNADIILLCVKSGDTQKAAKIIYKHAKPTALVISFQNGVRNGILLDQYLPTFSVLRGMVPFNVLGMGKGHFHCGTEGALAIEDPENRAEPVFALFDQAGLSITQYQDITNVQWGKLLMNLNNAVNALSGIPLLDQLNDANYRKIMVAVLREALNTMKAAGIEPARTGKVIPKYMPFIMSLPNFLFKLVASASLKIDPQARSSMYEDLSLGRKTEIDYLNGEILVLAKKFGIHTPANHAIVNLIKQAESDESGSPQLSAEEILSRF